MSGRKSLWEELEMDEKLILVEGWARDGLTDEQIYSNLGVSKDTFYRWKKKKSEFREALKRGKEVVDRMVENALLKAALGYEYEEEVVDNKGRKHTVRKYEKPNTTALIFWLKNRKPEQWRDRQEHKIDANFGVQIIDDVGGTDEED
ncbi:helix-turn-helix domain-containing protein [Anoxybacillus sp. CHMUD]|uniref:helix-turn-helix domain-containing protein n=1 Tax=Anoxybacillus sp. CHMUD TaxID=2508870 RepID=UPI001491FC18|nr:helix-turn-helix domain-containing protein [Anoxybacillus sp. CHMUD]NNU89777.1 helix-turn-helix domain-containing protein [Anoxybacillus sp. CHMUD]